MATPKRGKAAKAAKPQKPTLDLRDNLTRTDGDLGKLSRDSGRSQTIVTTEPEQYVTGPIVSEVPAQVRE